MSSGCYLVVVADHRTGTIESYGPLGADAAETMVDDLRALLREDGIDDVTVVVGRLHEPDGAGHPEDP